MPRGRCLARAEALGQPALAALSALGLGRLLAEHPELAQHLGQRDSAREREKEPFVGTHHF